MWLKWLPLKFMARRIARAHGFTDPIALLSHARRFSQPSEVQEPIELLRAGVVLHARGLINSRVIQHNLDWIWPYWINQQFEPRHPAFIPWSFSMTQINLSARNWTAVGVPGSCDYVIVDPRGLVMPFWDSWSIDAWILTEQDKLLAPAHLDVETQQTLQIDNRLAVTSESRRDTLQLTTKTEVHPGGTRNICAMDVCGQSTQPAWLVVSLRPYNPEGISFIHELAFDGTENQWMINQHHTVSLLDPPDRQVMSNYRHGDIAFTWHHPQAETHAVTCHVGMATAAAMYRLAPNDGPRTVRVRVPLNQPSRHPPVVYDLGLHDSKPVWQRHLRDAGTLKFDYKNYQFLFDAAIRSTTLHSPGEVYPGPFTYKRFWVRDAAIILYALLRAGRSDHCQQCIEHMLPTQTSLGHFCSQQGEWDSNGQVLWVMNQYTRLTGKTMNASWRRPVIKAANWLIRKRMPENGGTAHDGLLPAGFSAEHLGPNDYYYWDDFWAAAGLQAAAEMLAASGDDPHSANYRQHAARYLDAIANSLTECQKRLKRKAMPVSPYRRLDSASVSTLVACYPLGLYAPEDARVADTIDYLLDNCLLEQALFHDISHAGINPYLTLDLAQVMMRRGDRRFTALVNRIADLASPTGQWPEAINPRTGQGCMGDGQHMWAAAEWMLMMIHSFVLEQDGNLVLCAGVTPDMLRPEQETGIGPVPTPWGPVQVSLTLRTQSISVRWQGQWRGSPPQVVVRLPGHSPVTAKAGRNSVELPREAKA